MRIHPHVLTLVGDELVVVHRHIGAVEIGPPLPGVLLDTLLVRTVLVPASLLTIGERVWWPTGPRSPGPAR